MVGKWVNEVHPKRICEDARIWKIIFRTFHMIFPLVDTIKWTTLNTCQIVRQIFQFWNWILNQNYVVWTMRANKWNSQILKIFWFRISSFTSFSWRWANKSHIILRWQRFIRMTTNILMKFWIFQHIFLVFYNFWLIQMSTWWPSQRWVRLTPATKSTHPPHYVRSLIKSAGKGRTWQKLTTTGIISTIGECAHIYMLES